MMKKINKKEGPIENLAYLMGDLLNYLEGCDDEQAADLHDRIFNMMGWGEEWEENDE